MDQNTGNNVQQNQSAGLAIASMVLGIISLVLFCVWFISIPTGVIGLILSSISLSTKKSGRGMAIAGLVCSLIGIALYIIIFVLAGIGSGISRLSY